MKAAIKNNNLCEIKDLEKPILKAKGAIIKVLGCGLCGSDIVKLTQNLSKDGTVLGHEIVGVIEEINSLTEFKKGDKIAMGHHVPCFKCVYCKNENFSMCSKFKSTNIKPGGFSEYIFASEDHLKNTVVKIPNNITLEQASFMEPLACCLRAVKRAYIKEGDKVLIIGLGSIGLMMGQVAKHFKAKVYGLDIMEERQKLALEKNFDGLKTQEENFDKVFLVAGSDKTVDLALKSVRNGGEIIVFASVKNNQSAFANNEIYYRELIIKGSYSPSCNDLHESMDLIAQGIINVDNFSTVYSLEKINSAVEHHIQNKILKAFIKI